MHAHIALERIKQEKNERTGRLDLSALGLTLETLPDELWELEHLEELNLGNRYFYCETTKDWEQRDVRKKGVPIIRLYDLDSASWPLSIPFLNKLSSIPELLFKLQNLKKLFLDSNQTERLENLDKLPQLQSLSLYYNKIERLENLDKLPKLQSLDLSSNKIERLENLDKLPQLQSLSLSYNKIERLENLDKLPQLQSLSLYYNKIERLENLDKLPKLQSLDLSSNKIERLENLDKLPQLQSLSLYYNKIERLENLDKLPQLQSLSLSSNKIERLENLEALMELRLLNLAKNKLVDIQQVLILKGLKGLVLGGNKFELLPEALLHQPWLEGLNLRDSQVRNIPEEITAQPNCLEDAKLWFSDLGIEPVPNYDLKLIVCGNGRVGKSTIIDYLRLGYYNKELETTHAIKLLHWKPDEANEPLHVHIWDFGGQEIYHATHRLFMRTRAQYLVVYDMKTLCSDGKHAKEDGIFKNYGLSYWTDQCRSFAPNSPIILVENKIDVKTNERKAIPKNNLEKRFGHLQYEEVSAYTGENIESLKAKIIESFKRMPEYGMPMPGSWFRCREKIGALPETTEDIDMDSFIAICEEAGVRKSSQQAVLRYLHNSGALFYQSNLFQGRIILNQQRAIEGIYALFNRKGEYWELLRDRGPIRYAAMKAVWNKNGIDESRHRLLLTFMETCRICFPLKKDDQSDDALYIVPMFLPEEKPASVISTWQHYKGQTWYFRYKYEFLHRTTIHPFIVSAGKLADIDKMWFSGLYFTHSFTHVMVESIMGNEEGEDGYIQITLAGNEKAKLLSLVRKEFKGINPLREEEMERFVSLNGADFVNYKTLKENLRIENPNILSDLNNVLKVEDFKELMTEYKEPDRRDRTERSEQGQKEPETIGEMERDTREIHKSEIIKDDGSKRLKKVLFLAANPTNTAKLQCEKEHSQMHGKLQSQSSYILYTAFQINMDELIDNVVKREPHILHFAGHGKAGDPELKKVASDLGIDISDGGGLIMYDADKRNLQVISTEEIKSVLSDLKELFPHIELIVFNACFSEENAKAVSTLGITVIGISSQIPDEAAIGFTNGFYQQLEENSSIEKAVKVGRIKARVGGLSYPKHIVMYINGKKTEI